MSLSEGGGNWDEWSVNFPSSLSSNKGGIGYEHPWRQDSDSPFANYWHLSFLWKIFLFYLKIFTKPPKKAEIGHLNQNLKWKKRTRKLCPLLNKRRWPSSLPFSFLLEVGVGSQNRQQRECCRFVIGICGFLLRCHRAVTPAIMFWVDTWGDSRVSAGESGISGVDWDIGTFGMVARPLEFLSTFKLRAPPFDLWQEHQDSFLDETEKGTPISKWGGKNGAPLELWQDPRCSSGVEMCMPGNFFSFTKGFKDPF